jgi:hypothetical protein
MYWFCKVYVDGGEHYNCVASAGNDYWAAKNARKYYQNEGEFVTDVEAEMFNSFEHGDPTDYTIV